MNQNLHLYNSLSRSKERFEPIVSGRVGLYLCGVTVYDHSHIGHARVMVAFDVIIRWLQQLGYQVTFVRNFTDIDDKIIARANEANEPIASLTRRMIEAFHQDMDALGCLGPTLEPCATDHMDAMIAMIESLLNHGNAYVADSGDVLYAVRSFADYGRLSGKNIDDLESGSRVKVDPNKRDPLDFVLWKMSKLGEPAWPSPWGEGRPGWHIECSAMSCAHLGNSFDIHGGGMDLRFPHHENEIAQAKAANGGNFARYWLHNGFVNINNEKMSKSLGNFFTVREVIARYNPEVVRAFIVATHYRSPLDFSDQALDVAKASLDRLYETRQRIGPDITASDTVPKLFTEAMNDDFNTPEALAQLFACAHRINRALDQGDSIEEDAAGFIAMSHLLGLVQQPPSQWFQTSDADETAHIEQLIKQRNQARADRDFTTADQVRDQLAAMNITLKDSPKGTRWQQG